MKLIEKEKFNNGYKITLFGIFKIKHKAKKKLSEEQQIFAECYNKERFVQRNILFKGFNLIVPDLPSFAYQVKEIWENEIYKFDADTQEPVIYDIGANIGTSVLYFNKLYPNAKIKAFEADKKIYDILKHNTENLGNIEFYNNAVWINYDELSFNSEGADSGSLLNSFKNKQKVNCIRLKDLLKNENKIDFLKMDIEGAEVPVINDCDEELSKVNNIFIEYHSMIGQSQALDKILAILSKHGFRYFLETPGKSVVAPLSGGGVRLFSYNNMDLQVNIWGYKQNE